MVKEKILYGLYLSVDHLFNPVVENGTYLAERDLVNLGS